MVHVSTRGGRTQLTPDEERIVVRDLSFAAEAKLKQGDIFYLLSCRWWQDWVDYVNQDQQNDRFLPTEHLDVVSSTLLKRPSTIDNSDLLYDSASEDSFSSNGMELHDNLVEGRDYILLPQDVWKQIQSWYGGGPALPRRVISTGLSQTELSVEVYPLRLQLILMPKGDSSMIRVSRKETIRQLHQRAHEIFDLHSEQNSVYVWDYYGQQKHSLMTEMDKTLDDANLQMDQDILVEVVKNPGSSTLQNGSVEKETTSVSMEPSKSGISSAANKGASRTSRSEIPQNRASPASEPMTTYASSGITTRGSTCGLTGLVNLGNTCFMNSAIQCLVHTPEFAKYFQDDYHKEINWDNPLGMVGELALAFGELLRKLWAPGRTPVAPRPFKAKLARFATQFIGYNQHDAQELLAFLLDGLHEDLNRVKHKPYMKPRDADGRPDEEVADEYWANHIARNDSIIVDVCQGQYKSTLICPVCNKISVTFDPFMYLSLPLQSTTTRTMRVTVFTCDGSSLPTVCTVALSKQARIRDLMRALSNACSLKPNEKLLIAEIQNHVIKRILEDPVISLSTVKDDDHLAAYKLPKIETNATYLRVLHQYVDRDAQATSRWTPFGTPLVSGVSCNDVKTSGDLQKVVLKLLSPMLRTRGEENVDISSSSNPGASEAATLPRLPIQLLDGNSALIDLSLEDKAINLSTLSASSVIYVNWSPELLQKYDTRHLENLREVFNGPVTKKARSEPLSVYTCLEAFLREEPLVPEDMWYCPQCKERRQASKKLDLWRLPEVLVIHLKRFSYSRSMKHKLETFVNFPIHDLDLTNYVANRNNSQKQLYELYALINHYGGMGSGHYTAFIKLPEENKWYNFDDNHISSINEEEVKSNAAYVLFFRRVNTDDVSNGPLSL